MPLVGLGTWQSEPTKVTEAVKVALKKGYRHLDAAWIYGNEKEVGQGLKESGIPRDQVFITTKLWNTMHKPEEVAKAIDLSLSNLGIDYVDLYLIHWPFNFKAGSGNVPKNSADEVEIDTSVNVADTWKALEKIVEQGKAKAIGVSNFDEKHIEEVLKIAKIPPAVNQVELHPHLPQTELIEFCKKHNIVVTAYSPLGSTGAKISEDPVIKEVAKKNNKSEAQVLISWAAQRGTVVIPKSVTPERIESNFDDFILPEEDMKKINDISTRNRTCDPGQFWKLPLFQ